MSRSEWAAALFCVVGAVVAGVGDGPSRAAAVIWPLTALIWVVLASHHRQDKP